MTLEDKVALGSGKDFWHTKEMPQYGLQAMMMADGPHGLRKQPEEADMLGINDSIPATCFPTAALSACSFDENLVKQMGKAIAMEAKANKVSVVLGPGANIKRNPLCGRNFEYFSEDPFLTGKLAAAFIQGAESVGIGTSLKHFAMNNQEYKRFSSDSIVDERTMREIYLTGFEMAVKEGKPATVMCCYNKVNGIHGSRNKWLLTEVLRNDWGFDGLVMTDWGAMVNRMDAYQAGCDLSMPGGSNFMEKETIEAVQKGHLDVSLVDESAKRVLKMVENGLEVIEEDVQVSLQENFEFARKIAEESAVLLKNENHILPILNKEGTLFVGPMAKQSRYQGAGSSHINPWKLVSTVDACPEIAFVKGCHEDGSYDEKLLQEAVELAKTKETVVIFAGLTDSYESEGFDRENMKMPQGHVHMIEELSKVNSNVVVILMSGSAVEIPWFDKVKGLLYVGLCGVAGGEAISHLLFGRTNPCGRLAETWPLKYEDCISASYYGNPYKDAQYREGLYVGYRYYESAGVPVRFPFGYGLSYTNFTYRDLKLDGKYVTCKVKNTGNITGKEVVQLYIEPLEKQQYRAKRELKAFTKISLNPGEEKQVQFSLDERSFAIWDGKWKIPEGAYEICIGKDAHSMVLRKEIQLTKDRGDSLFVAESIEEKEIPQWYRQPQGIPTKEEFEALLGRKIIEKPLKKGEFSMENSVLEMKDDSLIMKLMYKIVKMVVSSGFKGKNMEEDSTFKMMFSSAVDCSLNGMKNNVQMDNHLLEGLLMMANGHYFKGIREMLRKS
ncbi:MAG: glycoside hydrolase family 3 C-terminal domain-containing protein [Lachnospiraceae bacterium]|nr:glycoside hydrolase family 3 C-terminal domain-containing protein [Lachnospiraceae bacterium]